MYLKRLELLGFKSFPDKTIIKLTNGVIGIVGPNGCGKTNILDAIRWVLGEQKVSLLRGTKMEEVIFNGTRDIKPLGMAEVTLVVQNSKGILPTEYNEVQITRRLFRSGESEYLLNKVPCRLKDISDLLMDTGMGAHIYSVIQQDMIDAILSDRTDDRRFLFEEAAGISKYKNRKKAAIRKLEATEQDLLRLKDIVSEVTVQVNSLSRQMKKAERYQKMAEELRSWDIFLSKHSVENVKEERRRLLAQKDGLLDNRIKCDTEIDTFTSQQEELHQQLTGIDRQLTLLANSIYEKSEEAHTLEKEITILREKRENARLLKDKNVLDIDAFRKRKEILAEQIAAISGELEQLGVDSARMIEEVSRLEKMLLESDDNVLQARRVREELNNESLDLEGKLSAGKSDDVNLKEQEGEIAGTLAELTRQNEIVIGTKENLIGRRMELEEQLLSIANSLTALNRDQTDREKEVSELNTRLEEISGELFDLTASLEAAEARKHLLTEMVRHYEGYGAGVVSAFENKEQWPGLIGTVADSLTPLPGYEEAIAAALGDMAEFMICRDRDTADQIIAHLRQEKKGKAGLIIFDEAEASRPLPRPEFPAGEIIGWADSFAACDERLTSLMRILLARVVVVRPDFNIGLLDSLPLFYAAVTTEGKMYQSRAVISGGSSETVSLFGRKDKIAEQERIIDDITARLDQLKNSRSEITIMLGSKQADVRSITGQIDNLKEDSEKITTAVTGVKFELQASENELTRIDREQKTLSGKLELLRNRQYNLSLNYDQLAREKNELMKRIESADADILRKEKEAEEIQSRLSAAQIHEIEARSRKQQLESQIRHTNELIIELEQNGTKKAEEIVIAEGEISNSIEKTTLLERQLKELFDQRSALIEQQSTIRQNHAAFQENLASKEKEIKTRRQMREEASNQVHAIELHLTEMESELKNTTDKIKNEYDLDLEKVSAEPPDSRIPQEKYVDRLSDLREQMKNFGAVNLLALEEYRTARERQEFLSGQLNDLLSAKSTLQSTITKINVTAKNLFLETFAKVGENFKKVFEELFTGGDAEIRLLDESDPLESPIEIIARPRGKKLLSIAQMSGGERALTAISLLFAIYLVKPSPFCILDEIDAPLDDANIHRFLRMIKAFSDQTQFIIITHNKITMEAADVLYGVTMEQPGISRVVSVRFNEEGDDELIDTSITEHEIAGPLRIIRGKSEEPAPAAATENAAADHISD